MSTSGGTRLSREQRRAQLIGLGLRLLETVPFRSLSVDDVAARAGISRSLLFHYFPTKRDYLGAVVRAAVDLVLDVTAVPEGTSAEDGTRAIVTALVRFIQLRRDNYVAIIRSGRSVDPALESVVDDMHRTLSLRVLESIGVTEPGPTALMLTRSWLAGVEEAALLSEEAGLPQEIVIGSSLEALRAMSGIR
jgi:AcrR family transcriptional regulator